MARSTPAGHAIVKRSRIDAGSARARPCGSCWGSSMARVLRFLSLLALLAAPAAAQPRLDVDLELILAVDVSLSMDYEELRLQREGYVGALRDPEVQRAIRGGVHGRIAIAYLEWAGWGSTQLILPWTIVDSAESAN